MVTAQKKLSKYNNRDKSEWTEPSANKAYGLPPHFKELATVFFFFLSDLPQKYSVLVFPVNFNK